MPADDKPTSDEMAKWARSYGLGKLTPEHIARMAELAVYVSELGRTLPRVPAKENAPAPVFIPPS
jgi:hypothetical protein